jgi:hypothetical protein
MNNAWRTTGLVGTAALLWLCAPGGAALANDTSLNVGVDPPRLLGEDLVPVRMAAEHITIHFGQERSQVEVEFTFHNLTDTELDCWAGFPDEDLLYRYVWSAGAGSKDDMTAVDELAEKFRVSGGFDSETAGHVENFTAWTRLAGAPPSANAALPWKVLRIESLASSLPKQQAEPSVAGAWAPEDVNSLLVCRAFQLHLEPGKDLVVGHSYDTATGSNVESQSLFQYQLVTGRNWQGTIGEATIDIYVDEGLDGGKLFFGAPELPPYYPVTVPGKTELKRVAPGHYQVVWRDFEPEGDKGWVFLATAPRTQEPDETPAAEKH